jgi:hypothetical protein
MQDEKQRSGIKWLATGVYLTLFSAIGLAGYLYLPALLPQQNNEIVVIKGEAGPFKTKPEEPGGKIITNQDSKVMEMLGALTPEKEDVETLLPPSGGPELPPVDVKTPETAEAKSEDMAVDGDKAESNTAESTGKSAAEAPKAKAESPATSMATGQNDSSPTSSQASSETSSEGASEVSSELGADNADQKTENGDITTPVAKPPVKTIVATPKPTAKEKEKEKGKDEPGITTKRVATEPGEPTYMIQLAAFRKEDIASEQAGLLLKKHETRLQGVTLGTMRIDTGDSGIFWRIVSEPLPREAADTICASLKRAGQDCILRKFTAADQ